ncbi:hypothetical protein ES288_A02G162800v1 [Gossypium darwinii]|uniref:Uncharacterized protein n=2 Tax=Gossypium TaxID=3633 RepID=A0A5D2RHW4_GOSTO|nr:hypothetical protein ES288_A02G162800v1 [Gossypium darwinii]TYI40447.1 hypothetical protein ES332_A02G163100v1 [Gossypium tomentosum]
MVMVMVMVFLPSHGILLPFGFPILVEVNLERTHVILETQCRHCPQQIIPVYGLPFLPLTLIGSLASDETDELRHTFLHCLFGFFGYFCVGGEGFFHYPTHVSYGEEPILFFRRTVGYVAGRWAADGAGLVSFPSHGDGLLFYSLYELL